MEYTVENLERALCQFYQNDGVLQPEIHQWLTEASSSLQAWNFVWDLLQLPKATEVKFFGATTLKTKIERFLSELNQEQILALKGQLLTTLITHSAGPKMIQSKLCSCLSAYLLQTCPEIWPDAVPELLVTLSPENVPQIPANAALSILLELLAVLPKELSTIYLSQNQRGLIRHHLTQNNMSVLNLLEKIISNHTDKEIIKEAVKCVSSWMEIGLQISECQNMTNLLISLIFNTYKQHPSICGDAVDALTHLVNQPEAGKYPASLLELLSKILPLQEIIARELSSPEPDEDVINDLFGLFVAFGESHARLCLDWIKQDGIPRQQALSLITCLLHCSSAKGSFPVQETHSRLAFGFWYMLQDEITNSESEDYTLFMKLLCPIYKELVDVLIVKARLPDPKLNASQKDLEAFRCYRQDISDTLTCCYSILRVGTISLIKSRFEKINLEESPWQELEACLFSLSSIAENVHLGEEFFLPALFQYIGNLPFQRLDPKVLATALDTIGAYAEWIASYKTVLEYVLPPIALGLKFPETSPNATMALKDLARDCQHPMKPYAAFILGSSQEALHGGKLKLNESTRLMFSVGKILSVLSQDLIMHYLDIILTPYLDQLSNLSVQQPSPQIKVNIVFILRILETLNTTLYTRFDSVPEGSSENVTPQSNVQPVLLILHKTLPLIKTIANTWPRDGDVMQAIFSALKHAVTTLLEDSHVVAGDLIDLIITSYKIHPHASALDLAKQFCLLFGKDKNYEAMLQSLTNELCNISMITVGSAPNLSDHRELLESLFSFLSHIIRKVPKLFAFLHSLTLFQCATVCLGLPELPTVRSAASFLVNLIMHSRELPPLNGILNAYGEQLITKMVSCIAGEATRANLEPLADVLLALNKKYCDNLARWLRQSVTERTCGKATAQQREQFIKLVLKERASKKKLQDVVKEFSFVCRGYILYDVSTDGGDPKLRSPLSEIHTFPSKRTPHALGLPTRDILPSPK